jgi:hypothetical protein
MTAAGATAKRPDDLDDLQGSLEELAVGGSISATVSCRDWLESICIAEAAGANQLIGTQDWLHCSLPAPSGSDLLVRTLLRDPLYRLHIDLVLAGVVSAIGTSGRWRRLEELLFGDLQALSPRIASLLKWVQTGSRLASWEDVEWRHLDALSPETAARFDRRCWGTTGESLFAVLHARYPNLAGTPVFVDVDDALLTATIVAAANGEGVKVSGTDEPLLLDLSKGGAPVWWRQRGDGSLEVTLSSPCRARGVEGDSPTSLFSRGVPALSRTRSATTILGMSNGLDRSNFWPVAESNMPGLAFCGSARGKRWPSDDDAPGRALPLQQHLSDLVRARRKERGASDPADDALRRLAEHTLFGFWIQVLLLEALDRELGEETLLLAPPTHTLVEDIEGATYVYYQPRRIAELERITTLEIGPLDTVMTQVAAATGINSVGALGDAAGPWSMGLALLAQVGVAQTRHDRWSLSSHALDRLHGGGLMTAVIRRGRTFRERLHDIFEGLWRERNETAREVRHA